MTKTRPCEIVKWMCRHLWPAKLQGEGIYRLQAPRGSIGPKLTQNRIYLKLVSGDPDCLLIVKTPLETLVLHFLCLCLRRWDNCTAFPDSSLTVVVHPVWTSNLPPYNSYKQHWKCISLWLFCDTVVEGGIVHSGLVPSCTIVIYTKYIQELCTIDSPSSLG